MADYRRLGAGDLPAKTVALAKALIGCILVRQGARWRAAGRIVETEAYVLRDPASHAYSGRSARNSSMFLAPFHAYIYLIYGTSFCLNVTSELEGEGAAVLLRALEPLEGLRAMERLRGTTRLRDLCRGPGRLAQALDIDRRLDGIDLLTSRKLWLAAPTAKRRPVTSGTRIGITKAASRKLRFYEKNNPFVSGPRSLLTAT